MSFIFSKIRTKEEKNWPCFREPFTSNLCLFFFFFLLPLSAVLSTSACLFLHFVLPCLHFCPASRLSGCLFFSSLLTLSTSLVFLSAAAAFFLYVRHQVKPHTPTCTTPPVSRDPFVTRASVSIPILLSGVRRSWPSLLLHIALRAELHNGSTLARLHTRLHVHTHTQRRARTCTAAQEHIRWPQLQGGAHAHTGARRCW